MLNPRIDWYWLRVEPLRSDQRPTCAKVFTESSDSPFVILCPPDELEAFGRALVFLAGTLRNA